MVTLRACRWEHVLAQNLGWSSTWATLHAWLMTMRLQLSLCNTIYKVEEEEELTAFHALARPLTAP